MSTLNKKSTTAMPGGSQRTHPLPSPQTGSVPFRAGCTGLPASHPGSPCQTPSQPGPWGEWRSGFGVRYRGEPLPPTAVRSGGPISGPARTREAPGRKTLPPKTGQQCRCGDLWGKKIDKIPPKNALEGWGGDRPGVSRDSLAGGGGPNPPSPGGGWPPPPHLNLRTPS